MKTERVRTPYRIQFFLTDNYGKEFMCLSMPYEKGDALKGYLRRAKKIVLKCRELYGRILRDHWGFRAMKLGIKIKILYHNWS